MIMMFRILLCLVLCQIMPVEWGYTQSTALRHADRVAWFTDARFGMFIHWGLYSGAEGLWKGEKHRHFNNYAEWIQYRNRIPRDEYLRLQERFQWDEIDPEAWVILAKNAGMKYITITAKHHDGFALWDTKVGKYGFTHQGGRDVIAELAAACKKHGIKMGLYYSHWVDWDHPYGWDHNQELLKNLTDDQFNTYWQEKVIPQLRELLTHYGDIAILWFDMWLHHSETIVKREQLEQVLYLVRELQPACLINTRLGLHDVGDDGVDFETLGDNELGSVYKKFPWQTPGTIAHSWGYHAYDHRWKSDAQLMHELINNVSLNGNYMLNIGPRADGVVPHESILRLQSLGNWLAINGDAIYGCTGLDLPADGHDWGRYTFKYDESHGLHKIYLHIFNWPLNGSLSFTGVKNAPARIYALADKQRAPLSFVQKGPLMEIDVPNRTPDPLVSVLVLEYSDEPQLMDDVVPKASYGGYSLKPLNARTRPSEKQWQKYDGTAPAHLLINKNQVLYWQVYIDKPGKRKFDISYSSPKAAQSEYILKAGNQSLQGNFSSTGKVVVEPNQNFYAEQFVEKAVGEINFVEEGLYDIVLEVNPGKGELIKFNWIWLQE
jgi:alpha-L-fucosidase